jgi:hypothetical protein
MKKNVKLALGGIGIAAVVYYIYKKMNPAVAIVTTTPTKTNYSGEVGDRLGFADGGYVDKGDLYNRNLRYGMTGQTTFFTNHSEKLNY